MDRCIAKMQARKRPFQKPQLHFPLVQPMEEVRKEKKNEKRGTKKKE